MPSSGGGGGEGDNHTLTVLVIWCREDWVVFSNFIVLMVLTCVSVTLTMQQELSDRESSCSAGGLGSTGDFINDNDYCYSYKW